MTPRRISLALGLFLLLAGIGLFVAGGAETEEDRLEAAWEALIEGFENEDPDDMAALFHDALAYRGVRQWVGSGERDEALDKLAEYWGQASDTKVITRELEVLPRVPVGQTRARGNLRFRYGESLAVWKYRAELTWVKTGDRWQVKTIAITELSPGLL